MASFRRIPFDSLALAAACAEMEECVGGLVQKVAQPDESTLYLGVYARRSLQWICLCWDALFFRAHLSGGPSRRPAGEVTPFCASVRQRLLSARLVSVTQAGFDRILTLEFEGRLGRVRLICELMGKHSNLILAGETGKIVAAAKWVGRSRSKRPVLPGTEYAPPPFAPRPPIWEARTYRELMTFEGASPFLVSVLLAKHPPGSPKDADLTLSTEVLTALRQLKVTVSQRSFEFVSVPGVGAYPVSVEPALEGETPVPSFGLALDQSYRVWLESARRDRLRLSLLSLVERLELAREVALRGLRDAEAASHQSRDLQRRGELILAYAANISQGDAVLRAEDYEGRPIRVDLDPEKTAIENAQAYFERARKAKAGASHVADQMRRVTEQLREIHEFRLRVESADSSEELEALAEMARRRRWTSAPPASRTGERPYEGHRIRELMGPGGVRVLFGENAEANDFLTLRVARPNDWWLHVRGDSSAHVLIPTANRPERIAREALMFAAQVAARHSRQKHATHVPVDYTLRKYVRKPKGSPPGTAMYTHEKTLHVDAVGKRCSREPG